MWICNRNRNYRFDEVKLRLMIHRLMNPRVCYVKTISNNMLPQRQFPGLTCRILDWTQPQWTPIESATTRLAIQINFFTPSHQISRNSTREWAEKLRRLYKSHEKYKIDDDSNEDQLQLCWIRLLPPISRNSSASELKSSESTKISTELLSMSNENNELRI